jgi:molybdopterin molybdotransferase
LRPFTSTISFEEARRRLAASVAPIARAERVPLAAAGWRVAAEDIVSPIDVPPFARSAMDGYALVAADAANADVSPVRLRVVEQIYTGRPPSTPVTRGTCAEIATGAPMPEGADAVVMVEQTSTAGDGCVDIRATVVSGQNIGRRGADIAAGAAVVRHGELLNPGRLGSVAAIGRPELAVYAKPRVAILSTGNEVVEPGAVLLPGQIFDVNRFTLASIVEAHGGIADPRCPVEDSVAALEAALDSCADADVIVFSGGSSVGERDLIVDVVAAKGEMVFHGIAIKPGKPTGFAWVNVAARRVPFFAMPGNPTSCLSNAYVLFLPFLRAIARLPPLVDKIVRLPLGRRIVSQAGRLQIYTVRLENGVAIPAFKGSGEITSLSHADGYIQIPPDQAELEAGSFVDVTLF